MLLLYKLRRTYRYITKIMFYLIYRSNGKDKNRRCPSKKN
nr:MAG TPA: hypothetical protein [Caudoviricetes sp.]